MFWCVVFYLNYFQDALYCEVRDILSIKCPIDLVPARDLCIDQPTMLL